MQLSPMAPRRTVGNRPPPAPALKIARPTTDRLNTNVEHVERTCWKSGVASQPRRPENMQHPRCMTQPAYLSCSHFPHAQNAVADPHRKSPNHDRVRAYLAAQCGRLRENEGCSAPIPKQYKQPGWRTSNHSQRLTRMQLDILARQGVKSSFSA
jgi:hypothetical protein